MKAYDYPEKEKRDQERQRILKTVDAQLARHEKVTRTALTLVLILAGLSLTLFLAHFLNNSN